MSLSVAVAGTDRAPFGPGSIWPICQTVWSRPLLLICLQFDLSQFMLSWHFLPSIEGGGVTIMSMELLQQPHSEVEKIDRLNDRWELVRGCLQ